jgi:hypothetical protein
MKDNIDEPQKPKGMSKTHIFLILESIAIFIGSLLIYLFLSGNWIIFLVLLLAPDIFMIGYLKNSQVGSIIYNIGYVYAWPIVLIIIGILIKFNLLILFSLIWMTHISMDRAMGYGLKYPSDFKDTHMQRI